MQVAAQPVMAPMMAAPAALPPGRPTPAEGMPSVDDGAQARRRQGGGSRSSRRWSARSTARRSPAPSPTSRSATRVAKGQILCIIEAMKIMNEIESEVTGVVTRGARAGRAAGRVRPGALPHRSEWLSVRHHAAAAAGWRAHAAPAAAFNFKAVLQQLVQRNASDLHLKVGRPPTLRLHGELVPLDQPALAPGGPQGRSPSS